MDNYISKGAQLSLQIRIVKSTSFVISTIVQAILVTQKQSQPAHLARTPTYEKIPARFFWYRIYNVAVDYTQKCDRC